MRKQSALSFVSASVLGLFLFSGVSAAQKPQVVKNTQKGFWGGAKKIIIQDEMVIGKEIGDESEMFGYVRDIVIDPDDNIYVIDSYEHNISVYNSSGEFLREFGREGQGPGEFQTFDGICWSKKDSNLYIADRRNHRINRFSPEGKYLGSVKDKLFNASIMDICSLEDGRFILTGRGMGERGTDNKIIITDFEFKNVLAELSEDFPSHNVGIIWAPQFSDVGAIQGDRIYYTSPSEYKIVVLDAAMNKKLEAFKSHPRMFIPQYVQGYYADFNTLESLLELEDMYVIGVQSTKTDKIPHFKTKREFIEFTHTPNLKEWNLEKAYQLDFMNKNFEYLGCVEIPGERRLAGKDSLGRLYFAEQAPYPRVIRSRLEFN
jgi:hypothetical protein